MKTFILTIFTTVLCAGASYAGVETGKPAPDFTAKDINGQIHKLSDYKGKIVVIESYNQDCPFCANHFKNGDMQSLQADITGKGGIWLLVNSVNPGHPSYRTAEAAKQEWTAYKIKATAWLDDSSGEIGKLYGMKTTPQMFVITPDGTLVYQGAIDDKADPKHDPKTARNYVKEAVAALREGKPVAVKDTKSYGCSVKYAN